jgi:leucine dehydrogenase
MPRVSLKTEHPTQGLCALYSYKIFVSGIGKIPGFIAIANLINNSALGGWRTKLYPSLEEAIVDDQRLACDMRLKFGFANIPMGGAKSCTLVDSRSLTSLQNKELCRGFAEIITRLSNKEGIKYITGKDIGRSDEDIALVAENAPGLAASGSPSRPTARGVFRVIRAFVPSGSIAIEGLGDVGMALAELLRASGNYQIYGFDKRAHQNEIARKLGIIITPRIAEKAADVFSGCAGSFGLNDRTIPLMNARYSIGSANIEMENPERDSLLLQKRGILALPGFAVNVCGAGSLINPFIPVPIDFDELLKNLEEVSLQIVAEALVSGKTPYHIAKERAETNIALMEKASART